MMAIEDVFDEERGAMSVVCGLLVMVVLMGGEDCVAVLLGLFLGGWWCGGVLIHCEWGDVVKFQKEFCIVLRVSGKF